MDIFCKQGKGEWYESAFVVNVENNEFSLGPFKRWQRKNIEFKGKIEGNKIKISESVTFKNGYQDNINYSGEFINDKEAILKGSTSWTPPWKCNGRFFKVNRPPHLSPLKYLSEATEEIIKFTSYNPGFALAIINGTYTNSPVEVSGKLILPKEGKNLPVVVTVHSSGGPSEFTDVDQSWRKDFKNQLLKNNIGIFEIDNFTSRGTKETASNQGKVSINAGELDALVAYEILDKHPRVNAKKLGITGLSRGGNAANMAVEKKFSDVILGILIVWHLEAIVDTTLLIESVTNKKEVLFGGSSRIFKSLFEVWAIIVSAPQKTKTLLPPMKGFKTAFFWTLSISGTFIEPWDVEFPMKLDHFCKSEKGCCLTKDNHSAYMFSLSFKEAKEGKEK